MQTNWYWNYAKHTLKSHTWALTADNLNYFRFFNILGINCSVFRTFSSHYAMDFRPQSIVFLYFIFILLLLKVNSVKTFLFQNVFDVPELLATPGAKFKITKDAALCEKQVVLLVGGYERKELGLKGFRRLGEKSVWIILGQFSQLRTLRAVPWDKAHLQWHVCWKVLRTTLHGVFQR